MGGMGMLPGMGTMGAMVGMMPGGVPGMPAGMGMMGAAPMMHAPNGGVTDPPADGVATGCTAIATPGAGAAAEAANASSEQGKTPDGRTKARDFSFLVTEDKQEAGPNLSMLDASSEDDSDDDDAEEGQGEDPDDMSKFEVCASLTSACSPP